MQKRLFIALNLSADVKDSLAAVLNGVPLPRQAAVRVAPRENWHITVLFLGDQAEEDMPKIEAAMAEAVRKRGAGAPRGKLRDIAYGPPGARPRMIWANVSRDASDGIGYLKKVIESGLAAGGVAWRSDGREKFDGHVTLARFAPTPLRSLPPLHKPLNFSFTAPTLDLMESRLGRGGPVYAAIAKIAF